MLLRNLERYREVLEVNTDLKLHRHALSECEPGVPTNGFFFDHNGTMFGLGSFQGTIFVLLQDRLLLYEPGFTTQIDDCDERRVFTASLDVETLIRVKYTPMKPFWNFFAMEDEDVDGFLWIHNVLSSDERRTIFIDKNNG